MSGLRHAVLAAAATVFVATSSHAQTVADIAARHACDTSGVEALSNQLITVQECLHPGQFVSIVPHANVTLTSAHLHPFMVSTSRDAVWAASGRLDLQVDSVFRTLADQYVLYYSGACALAAYPGNSNHETGRAIDLANWSAAVSAMTAAGCTHTYPSSDPVHFDCPGTDLRSESVQAFQHLWNLNNPGDTIAEDGAYGPMTEARLARSPANGFPNDGSCTTPPPPTWGAQFVAQSFPLAGSGALMMHVGESVPAWIDLRNIGTHAWDTNTRLGTTQPRDRSSPFVAPDWIGPNRPAGASGAVAMGATHRFAFTFQAPATPGTYDEHFGVLEEGVTWFSDPGEGGPPDGLLEARIVVLPPVMTDAGVSDASAIDAASDGANLDGRARDASDAGFITLPDGARVPATPPGCGCATPAGGARSDMASVVFAAVIALAMGRRKRKG